MFDEIDRGSGTVNTVASIAVVVALLFGSFAGVSAVIRMTTALRTAEAEAMRLATFVSEGLGDPCSRAARFVVTCSRADQSLRINVTVDGVVATATAGPR